MRHRKSGRKFDTNAPHRKAMFRNMVTALIVHGQIKTTTQRAKELRKVADRVITLGKNAPSKSEIEGLSGTDQADAKARRVAAIRRARLWVTDKDALGKLFGEYADRFRTRPGGYTRILKSGWRAGDNAEMAVIAFVEALDEGKKVKAKAEESSETRAADDEATVAYDEPVSEVAAEAVLEKDDLTKIEGIGPKIKELLWADGISTFAELASVDEARIQGILDEAGSKFNTANPGTWPEQAALARDGNWSELEALQEKLDGGV